MSTPIKLTGFEFFEDNNFIIKKLTGFEFEYIENLSISVVDIFDQVISNAKILIKRDGTEEILDLPNGEWQEFVDTPIDFEISAFELESYVPETPSITFNFDGHVNKSVKLVMLRVNRHRMRVVRGGVFSRLKPQLVKPPVAPTLDSVKIIN